MSDRLSASNQSTVAVGVLITRPNLRAQLDEALHLVQVKCVWEAACLDSSSLGRLRNKRPALVLIEQPEDLTSLPAQIDTLRSAVPEAALIVIGSGPDPEAILESVRAGANDFLYAPFDESLAAALARLQPRWPARGTVEHSSGGKVLGFLSVKGGCGATTAALYTALSLRRESETAVALADLDLTAGMLGFLTHADAHHNCSEAAQNTHRLDESFWSALVTQFHGVDVLPAPAPSAAPAVIGAEQFAHVVEFMRSRYAWSVVDLGRGLNPFSSTLLERIDELFLVTTADAVTVARTKHIADTLREAFEYRNIRLLLNRAGETPAVSVSEIEVMTGLPVYASIPLATERIYEALLDRRLVSDGSELAGRFRHLAGRIAGAPQHNTTVLVTGLLGTGRRLLAKFRSSRPTAPGAATPQALAAAGWESECRTADAAFQMGEYRLAAGHLSSAVEHARNAFGDDDVRVGKTLNRLGAVLGRDRQYAESERSLKLAAATLERALGPSDPAVLEALTNLAGVLKASDRLAAARDLYQRVLELSETEHGPSHSTAAWALDALGDISAAQHEFAAALYSYRRALAIKERLLGSSDWDVAVTLEKIGDFYLKQGRYNEAEPFMWRSITIRATVLGDRSPALSRSYSKLGILYTEQRKFSDAERVLQFSVALAASDEDIAPSLYQLADVYAGLGRLSTSETIRSVAIAIARGAAGSRAAIVREFRPCLAAVPRPSPVMSDQLVRAGA